MISRGIGVNYFASTHLILEAKFGDDPNPKNVTFSFACLSSHFMADDKRLKLKEFTQGEVLTP